jgi:hypothetical protein
MTRLNGLEIRSQVWNFWPRNDLLSTKNKMERGKCVTHLSLFSIKDPVFSAEAKKGIKKAETPFQASRSNIQRVSYYFADTE